MSIECRGSKVDGDLVTYVYDVRRFSSGDTRYHWVLALCQMVGLAKGKTIRDFVASATCDDRPVIFVNEEVRGCAFLGLDPTTHIMGCRFDEVTDRTGRYTITFDTSIPQQDTILDTGNVLAATAVGKQDIQNAGPPSPGYLCVLGPVCASLPSMKVTETAFAVAKGRTRHFIDFDTPHSNRESSGCTNGPFDEGLYRLDLRVHASQETDRDVLVGSVYLSYHASVATVVYDMDIEYGLEEVHLYVGKWPLPRGARGNITLTSSHFPYTDEHLGGLHEHAFMVPDLTGPIYVVAHATVCRQE